MEKQCKNDDVGAIFNRPQTPDVGAIANSRNTGITLIALVVTIIVLLILAGVSLSLVAGGNGIVNKAGKAVDATNEASLKEEVELTISELQMDYYLGDMTESFVQYLQNKVPISTSNDGVIEVLGDDFIYEDEKGNQAILSIDENGNFAIEGITMAGGETKRIERSVTYSANGGTGSVPEARTYERKATVNVDFTTLPTREGYAFLGWATTSDATSAQYTENGTKQFAIGTSNVTLYAVWQDVLIGADNYGDSANYSANRIDDWKVFLNDGTNIYLIASDYVLRSKLNMTSDVQMGNGNYSVKGTSEDALLSWLTNDSNWSKFAEGMNGATATGGATGEQFLESYNQKYGTNYSAEIENLSNDTGYSDELYFPHKQEWNDTKAYWLTSLSINDGCLGTIRYDGLKTYYYFAQPIVGVRPLVRLPAGVKAVKGSDEKWTFSK